MRMIKFQIPNFSRYFNNFKNFNNLSVFRVLTNEKLETLKLDGRILDYGGGEVINYRNQVNQWIKLYNIKYESINIDSEKKPTYLVDEGKLLNIESKVFDMVVSFNTFEHIYDVAYVFDEIHRMLKPKGTFIFIVPFIIRVHGHPDDFLRGTPSYWNKLLNDSGFKDVNIDSINWGPFTTGQAISGIPGPFKKIRKMLALLLDILYFKIKKNGNFFLECQEDDPICSAPLGYCISSTKN